MAQAPRDPSVLLATLALVDKHGGNVRAASREAGLPPATFQHRYEAAKQWSEQGHGKVASTESVSVTGNDCEITKTTTQRIKTLADLVRVCEIDTQEWDVERWVCNKWDSTAMRKNADGTTHPVVTEQFQVKAWLKRRLALVAAKREIAQLLADAKGKFPALPRRAPAKPSAGFLLELNVADLHNGKLAWKAETGENYDSRTAEQLHDAAVEALLKRTSTYPLAEILLVVGNDLLHTDSRSNTTTAGTPQDTDSRYYKVFLSTRRMLQRTIERCRTKARVRVVMVPGNHDRDSVWHMGDSLSCVYANCRDVTVDNEPAQRKYVEFGRCMVLLTHGDKGKREDYPLLMATEQPAMFGRTLYREAHTGHLHQTKVQEYHGVRVRILPSLAGADAWHAENGYVGNIRAAEAFVWSADEGLVATAYYTVPAPALAEGAA
jgi:predicted phosphodiesterase